MTALASDATTLMIRVADSERVITIETDRRFRNWLKRRLKDFEWLPEKIRPYAMEHNKGFQDLITVFGWEDSGGQLEPDEQVAVFPPLGENDSYMEPRDMWLTAIRLEDDKTFIAIGEDADGNKFRTVPVYLEDVGSGHPTKGWK